MRTTDLVVNVAAVLVALSGAVLAVAIAAYQSWAGGEAMTALLVIGAVAWALFGGLPIVLAWSDGYRAGRAAASPIPERASAALEAWWVAGYSAGTDRRLREDRR